MFASSLLKGMIIIIISHECHLHIEFVSRIYVIYIKQGFITYHFVNNPNEINSNIVCIKFGLFGWNITAEKLQNCLFQNSRLGMAFPLRVRIQHCLHATGILLWNVFILQALCAQTTMALLQMWAKLFKLQGTEIIIIHWVSHESHLHIECVLRTYIVYLKQGFITYIPLH